jgi:hypothetical protein
VKNKSGNEADGDGIIQATRKISYANKGKGR